MLFRSRVTASSRRSRASARLAVSGPIFGDPPGRATVIGLGGGAEGGWRIRQWVGLGAAFSRQPHEVAEIEGVRRRGYLTAWDIAFVRLYAPIRGRVDPYVDLGGGLTFHDVGKECKIGRASCRERV